MILTERNSVLMFVQCSRRLRLFLFFFAIACARLLNMYNRTSFLDVRPDVIVCFLLFLIVVKMIRFQAFPASLKGREHRTDINIELRSLSSMVSCYGWIFPQRVTVFWSDKKHYCRVDSKNLVKNAFLCSFKIIRCGCSLIIVAV